MSLQEPQEQFEHTTEESMDETQDSSVEAPLSDSDKQKPTAEAGPKVVPSTEKLPQPSETSIHTEGVDGPAWYVIHCYSGYENKVRHNLSSALRPWVCVTGSLMSLFRPKRKSKSKTANVGRLNATSSPV